MSILWCGGEDIDFNGSTAFTPGNSYSRPGYSRGSLYGANAYAYSNTFAPALTTWLSFRIYSGAATTTHFIGLVQSGPKGIWLSCDGSYRLTIVKYDGTTSTVLCTEPTRSTLLAGIIAKVDICITYGVSGAVTLYVGGNAVASYAGDTTIAGVTSLDSVGLYGSAPSFSEIIVSDTDTRLMSLATLAPNAAGDSNAWTGAYTDINETTVNDATVVYTDTTTADAQFALSNLPSGTFTIKGVRIAARSSKSAGAGAGSVCLGVKSGGTVDSGASQACDTAWATKERIMQQNPVTSNNWQASEINALQLNIRSAA